MITAYIPLHAWAFPHFEGEGSAAPRITTWKGERWSNGEESLPEPSSWADNGYALLCVCMIWTVSCLTYTVPFHKWEKGFLISRMHGRAGRLAMRAIDAKLKRLFEDFFSQGSNSLAFCVAVGSVRCVPRLESFSGARDDSLDEGS